MNRELPEEEKGQEVHNAGCCTSIHVLLEDNFEGHQGYGLYNHNRKQYLIFTVGKRKSLSDLLKILAGAMKYSLEELRLWSILLPSGRPSPINMEQDLDRLVWDVAERQNPWTIFVEIVSPDSDSRELPQFDAGRDALLFFKLYDPKSRKLHYCGHQYFPVKDQVEALIPVLNKRAGFSTGTPLALYEETESSGIEKIENMEETLESGLENVQDSAIVVFHKVGDGLHTCEDFYGELPHRVDVTFCDKTIRHDPGIVVNLSTQMKYPEVVEAIAERVGTEQQLVQLFTWHNCLERPGPPVQCSFDGTLSQLIECGGKKHKLHSKIFYCKLPIPVSQLEESKSVKCMWVGRKLGEGEEMTLYPSARGTVADLLEEAKRKVELPANGSGKLRILEVKRCRIMSVLKEEMLLESLKPRGSKTFRVEEVPLEEVELVGDERITPVMQFFRTTYSPFGVPFLVKVKHKEPFTSVKRRILEKLDIPEDESEEFDICLVANYKPKRCDESECVNVEKFQWRQTQDNSTPVACLGLRHLKDSRVRYSSK